MMDTPDQQPQLTQDAAAVHQGLLLLTGALEATISYLDWLITDARHSQECESAGLLAKRRSHVKLDIEQTQQSLSKIERLTQTGSTNLRSDLTAAATTRASDARGQ